VSTDWPWSRPVRWTDVVVTGLSITLISDEFARDRIAEGLDVEKIEILSAEMKIAPWLDGFEATGTLLARAVRICGVSLEPFVEQIVEPVILRFVPSGSPNAPLPPEGDMELDLDADDPPDSVAGDSVDLGYFLTEQVALALSAFPRKPGVEFKPPASSGSISPFAALANMKVPRSEDTE
jgi:hypothetical protein